MKKDWIRIDCENCPERFCCDQVRYDCPLEDPPMVNLIPIDVAIDTERNFTPSDLLYIYSRQTPGVRFGHTHYGESFLYVGGKRYLYDHWEIMVNMVRVWIKEA